MSTECPQEYAHGLSECSSLDELREFVHRYAELAKDAVRVVDAMTVDDFTTFRKGLKLERRGRFAGEDYARRFAAVMMPNPMFTIAAIANEYHVPFAVAHQRVKAVRPDLLEVKADD